MRVALALLTAVSNSVLVLGVWLVNSSLLSDLLGGGGELHVDMSATTTVA
jgi:hypothetical protein